ncbi:MAG: DUF1801 domain-containing protein [Burkholderiales bacterium]
MRANPTHCTFFEFLEGVEPQSREICQALRETITQLHRSFVETAWRRQRIASYGIGPRKLSEHYAYIAPQKSHVNLGFYRGAFLNDPTGLLQGTGMSLRHVKVEHAALASSPQLKSLIRQAISERLASRQ